MFNYQEQDKIFPPCPLCDGMNFRKLASNDRYDMGVRTVGCLQCGLVQTWPRLTSETMSLFYREHYRQYYQATSRPDQNYLNNYHKKERLEYTAKLIASHIELVPGMRILDVGCAEGTLFVNLKKHCDGALDLVGVEPSENYAAFARDMVACKTFPTLNALQAAEEDGFDLIIVNHVLEHVDDPTAFLAQLRDLLRYKGRIFVDVPDVSSYSSPADLHIAHNFHFSRQTLTASIGKAGLKVLDSQHHAPPYHPVSVWGLGMYRKENTQDVQSFPEPDKAAWGLIRKIDKVLPFYLFKRRILKSRLVGIVRHAWNIASNRQLDRHG